MVIPSSKATSIISLVFYPTCVGGRSPQTEALLRNKMAEVLALVDVDSESAPETWPLLLEAVRNAHFTALDLVSTHPSLCTHSLTVPNYARAVVLHAETYYRMRVVGMKIFLPPTCAGVEWSW